MKQLPDIVRKDILSMLKGVKGSIKKGDSGTVKALSNHTIHNASIFQDRFSTTVATTVYSLAKILENKSLHENHPDEWRKFMTKVNSLIDELIECASDNKCVDMDKHFQELVKTIAVFDEKFTEYVGFVIEQSKVKKGIDMYRHGVSLSRVSEILGVSLWDLMDYAGKTKVTEDIEKDGLSSRFENAKRLFQ